MSASIDHILTMAFRKALGFDPVHDPRKAPARLRRVSESEHEEILRLHGKGIKMEAIAAQFGRSHSTIWRHCQKNGTGPSNG